MKKITKFSYCFVLSLAFFMVGFTQNTLATTHTNTTLLAPNEPAGFVVFDDVGGSPVNSGELFLACGPNDVEDADISYRLFYAPSDAAPSDPTTATEYPFGDTPGDGDGNNAFGFVISGLNPGVEYTFWLYQFETSTSTFSAPAVASEVSGGSANGGDDPDPDPDPEIVVVQDFEDASTFTSEAFEGLAGAVIEAAPEGSNGNSLKLESVDSGNPWQGAFIVQSETFLDLTSNKTVEVDVYATQTFNLLLKVENGGPDAAASQSYTEANTWQTLTFTIDESLDGTAVADGIYDKVVFFPNWNDADTGFDAPSNFTVYVDNLKSVSSDGDDGGDNGGDPGDPGEIGEESVTVDASASWNGFANVFDLPADGGEFIFASPWGVPDLRTDIDTENNNLTLFPNFNTYADNTNDPFWVDQTTNEGNKTFEANTFIESTALAGNILEFSANVESFTISSDYEVSAFIRVFNADFSFNKSVTTELTGTGNFTIIYDDVDLENDVTVQYGFTVVGQNANPADETALGNVVVGPTTLSNENFETLELDVYPNPVSNILHIQSAISASSTIELYSLNGRLLFQKDGVDSIDMGDYANGMYLLRLTSNGNSITKKVIKK